MNHRKTFVAMIAALALLCFASAPISLPAAGVPSVPPVNFAPPVNYTVGTLPFANAVGDFNGDKILDIAVVNNASNNVSVLFGNGDGTFQSAVNYPVGSAPSAITAIDLNNDGVPDIAVANEIGKTVSVLINKADGSGTFFPAVNYAAGQAPRGIVGGDTRGIGIIDLLVANNLGGNATVFLGNGDGTFQPGVNYSADVNPKSVAVGYFNNSSTHLDMAVANHDTNDVSVLIGNGDGTFQAPVNYAVGIDPRHVLVADFNKDGKMDLATANGGESSVSILYGNGDGTFQPQVKYLVSTSPRWLAIADYNNDGFADIATSNYDAKNISILLGTGSSVAGQAFGQPSTNYIVGANPTGLVAGDFNGDGLPDIAVTIGGLPTAPNTLMGVLLNVPVTVAPTSLVFPTQLLLTSSAPMTVTLTNSAPNSLTISNIAIGGTAGTDYKQTNNCGSALSGNASCTINIVFTPSNINSRGATLTITDSAPGGSQTVALTGVGTAAGLSPSSLTFAAQAVGTTSAPQTITMSDASGTALTISSIAVTGTNSSDFAQTNTCGTSLAGKKSCTITVTFTPTASGTRTAAVTVTDNGGGGSQSVALTGTGTVTVSLSPTSLTFPNQVLGTASTPLPATLTNMSAGALNISSITVTGADPKDFTQTNNCGTSLAGNSSCTINVTFKSTSINHRTATLTVIDDSGTQTVALAGAATAASFSPTSLTFGAQSVGTSSTPLTITLTDASGGTAITISSITVNGTDPGDFTQTNTCGTSVAPKKSCTISVTFKPTATGTRVATISVIDNAGLSPQSVPLSGTGR